jgi:hypothetical protein
LNGLDKPTDALFAAAVVQKPVVVKMELNFAQKIFSKVVVQHYCCLWLQLRAYQQHLDVSARKGTL